MHTQTIGTNVARQLVEANAIGGAAIVGQSGGWSVVLRVGAAEKLLGTQRADKPRIWRSLDSCVQYLKNEMRIVHIESVDTTNYSAGDAAGLKRPDTTRRLKRAHEAAAYDAWVRGQVQEALDDPGPGIPKEEVEAYFAKKRDALRKRVAHSQA